LRHVLATEQCQRFRQRGVVRPAGSRARHVLVERDYDRDGVEAAGRQLRDTVDRGAAGEDEVSCADRRASRSNRRDTRPKSPVPDSRHQ
jgi:hypothetical protein